MADYSDSESPDTGLVDLSKIDKGKLLRAEERRRRANDDYGEIEQYISQDESEGDINGESGSDSSDESDVEEDDIGELITPELDAQIMKTLTALRSKDKSIYDNSTNFFSEDAIKKSQESWKTKQEAARKKAESGMTMTQYQHKLMVEHGGVVDEDKELRETTGMTHVQEQEALKNEFKAAFGSDNGDDSGDEGDGDDDFLVKKVKTEDEIVEEEADYRKFLLESMGENTTDNSTFASWIDKEDTAAAAVSADTNGEAGSGSANKEGDDQKFLMNYILNRGWIDKSASKLSAEEQARLIVDNEEDQRNDEINDNFESRYNFRYEEEGGAHIKSYPREIEGSMRRKDERRKLARERANQRKKEKKQEKQEELKRMKNQKKKEILEKLKEIQGITGNSVVGFDTLDLNGDFDPSKFDTQMDTIFNENFYGHEDNEKPVWDDDIDIGDIVAAEENEKSSKKGKHGSKKGKKAATHVDNDDDGDFIMDADYLDDSQKSAPRVADPEAIESSKSELKDKVSEYMDKYYQLDFEDVVGDDLLTRFKYAKVKPVDYGLSAAEILLADEDMVGQYVPVKRIAPFIPDWKIEDDMAKYANKKRLIYLKKKAAKKRADWENELKQIKKSSKTKKDKGDKKDRSKKRSRDDESGKSEAKGDKPDKKSKKSKKEEISPTEAPSQDGKAEKSKANRRQRQKAKKAASSADAAHQE
ncbi:Ribosome biogenesis protein Kri1 [Coemansia interrupta]|uniref:Ribosome biogenesis protein Kri1 n=1 Tax=Coemansia interrupta TaxID=1126814 RepID=A0A9W8HIM2_9FUNG|nr:Ribosome biogenesis protein Kri1 [Coemansia interrupta]